MVENNLMITRPDLCKEWNYNKNYPLRPEDIKETYSKKVWWLLHYKDTKTGKIFDFEWETSVYDRAKKGFGCPYLSNHRPITRRKRVRRSVSPKMLTKF